jgi:hypothetical protein
MVVPQFGEGIHAATKDPPVFSGSSFMCPDSVPYQLFMSTWQTAICPKSKTENEAVLGILQPGQLFIKSSGSLKPGKKSGPCDEIGIYSL